jgi:hypothetical protein
MLGDEGPDLDRSEDVLDGPGVNFATFGGRHGQESRVPFGRRDERE